MKNQKFLLFISLIILSLTLFSFLSLSYVHDLTLIIHFYSPQKPKTNTFQFEGNPTHVYYVNITTGYFSLNVNSAIVVPPSIYGQYLIITTSGQMDMQTRSLNEMLGCVIAVNINNGKIIWKDVFPNQIMTQPIIVNGTVVVGLGNAYFINSTIRGNGTNAIVAINIENGKEIWNFSTLGEDMPTPVYYNGNIIEPNGNGCIYAINLLTGTLSWKTKIYSYVSMSSPVLVNGSMYFGSAYPYVFFAINASNGKILWDDNFTALYNNYCVHGLDDSSPAYSNGIVTTSFTLLNNSNSSMVSDMLTAINATSGRILWVLNEGVGSIPPNLESPPEVIYNGTVFQDTPSVGILYAVNLTTGKVIWEIDTGPTTSNIDIYNNYVMIQNSTGTLFIINNGKITEETQLGVMPGPGNLLITRNSIILVGINGEIESIPLKVFQLPS